MTATTAVKIVQKRKGSASARGGILRRAFMLLALPTLLVVCWWLSTLNSTNYLNPPLATIVAEFVPTWFGGDSFAESRFMQDVVPSAMRIVAGFLIALVIGIVVGVMIGSSKKLRVTLEPILEFFRAIPPPVMVPILMLFMGIGDGMKVTVITIGCVWPILLNAVEGVRALDPVLKDTASIYRFSRWGRLTKLVLPGASPQIVTGARQALPIGIILMVISEMYAAVDGLGFTIVQFQRSFAVPQMWGGVIILGVLGVIFAVIFRAISGAILKWYYGYQQTQRGGA